MKKQIYIVFLQILGVLFLILGVIGIFVPILQGILFIIIGLVIISFTSPTFETWLEKVVSKNPTIHKHYTHHRDKIKRIHKNHKS